MPHGQRPDTEEVCLFTRDEPKMTPEQTQRFYKKLLEEKGVKNVTEVFTNQRDVSLHSSHFFIVYTFYSANFSSFECVLASSHQDCPDVNVFLAGVALLCTLKSYNNHEISLNPRQIIPYKVLRTEYKPFEAKRRLLGNFDMFLSDNRIRRLLPSHLGKHFYLRKR